MQLKIKLWQKYIINKVSICIASDGPPALQNIATEKHPVYSHISYHVFPLISQKEINKWLNLILNQQLHMAQFQSLL